MRSYFQRFGYAGRQIESAPEDDLSVVVVVPCFDEPDLVGSLESLWNCEPTRGAVEVIVVLNSSESCATEIRERNAETLRAALEWHEGAAGRRGRTRLHLLEFPKLPRKHAGVGLARKIGMDEALRRLQLAGTLDTGVILNFDADCRCDPTLLANVEGHFGENPLTPGCSIYFEHPLSGALDSGVYRAVAMYELHLRYYVEALRFARFPHAFHTVGSSMAVRAPVYAAQGGMNKRKAGEDFYFLQKVMRLGGYTDLINSRVMPSPRPSNRVPFGTGRAVGRLLETGDILRTYPLEAFVELRQLFSGVPEFYRGRGSESAAGGKAMKSFLEAYSFGKAVEEMRQNSAGLSGFEKRFFQWFDGFRVMKFVHHARDTTYGEGEVTAEALRLLLMLGRAEARSDSVTDLLEIYRRRARSGAGCFAGPLALQGSGENRG